MNFMVCLNEGPVSGFGCGSVGIEGRRYDYLAMTFMASMGTLREKEKEGCTHSYAIYL